MGDFFQQFVEDEARAIELTMDEIRHGCVSVGARNVCCVCQWYQS
jgi:hypothetical protein